MSHFAQVQNGLVIQVLVIDQEVVDSGLFGDPNMWIQTSYNTYGNVHYAPNTNPREPDGEPPLRANYAGIGYTYDPVNDVFYAPQPDPSYILNTSTWLWDPPPE
jgi:hypothetical protein